MIHLDLETERFWIGQGELTGLSPSSYKMLRYLYEQRRMVVRAELYYRVYRGLDIVPQGDRDAGWEALTAWSGTLDTIVWRLRNEVELYPRTPIYIITERGKGLRLENAW
jgi:DNA-binding response OmpR family regulator